MDINGIKELVNAVNKTEYAYINIKHEGSEITLSNNVPTLSTNPPIKVETTVDNQVVEKKSVDSQVAEKTTMDIEDCRSIKSPLVGTFYAAASPDADNFVKVGDKVKAGDTLCIIEAMKLMNDITAEIDGEIVEILVANEEAVEYGQDLFKIK